MINELKDSSDNIKSSTKVGTRIITDEDNIPSNLQYIDKTNESILRHEQQEENDPEKNRGNKVKKLRP